MEALQKQKGFLGAKLSLKLDESQVASDATSSVIQSKIDIFSDERMSKGSTSTQIPSIEFLCNLDLIKNLLSRNALSRAGKVFYLCAYGSLSRPLNRLNICTIFRGCEMKLKTAVWWSRLISANANLIGIVTRVRRSFLGATL